MARDIIEVRYQTGKVSQIVIGKAAAMMDQLTAGRRVIVITDANIDRCFHHLIERYDHILTGAGETNKTLITVEKIYDELIARNIDREAMIIGIGGGIVTDMAGFVASTYMRGLRFGFVATTLLAQVDASVGGKNGVNLQGYKNMVGTFSQPDFVLCDTDMLRTLPEREFRAGLAEVIKSAVIGDSELFEILEEHTFDEMRNDTELLRSIITRTIKVKAAIVEQDEREAGIRKLLNLGHTFAHAVEKSTSQCLHGEAVAIGMRIAVELSAAKGILAPAEGIRIISLIQKVGLPTTIDIGIKRLLAAVRLDKKRDNDNINFVLIESVGKCRIVPMTLDELDTMTRSIGNQVIKKEKRLRHSVITVNNE